MVGLLVGNYLEKVTGTAASKTWVDGFNWFVDVKALQSMSWREVVDSLGVRWNPQCTVEKCTSRERNLVCWREWKPHVGLFEGTWNLLFDLFLYANAWLPTYIVCSSFLVYWSSNRAHHYGIHTHFFFVRWCNLINEKKEINKANHYNENKELWTHKRKLFFLQK